MKISMEISKPVFILLLMTFGIGYLVGNSFSSVTTIGGTGSTIVAVPDQQPQQTGAQAIDTKRLVDDDAFLGNDNAEVIVVEFSDFQCPFCRRSYNDALPQLKSNYIETGKVKFVYRDFPLSFHPMAQPTAEATECAEEQGKFWEMHDKIFDKQNEQGSGTISFEVSDLKEWAKEVGGLDYSAWEQCLDSGKYASEVQADFNDGSAFGVSGTPSFFIGNDKNGYQQIVGAQPYTVFQQAINRLLA